MIDANKLPRPLRKHAAKIHDISDERGSGDGYWVYLERGWILYPDGTHQAHEDTPTQCAQRISDLVERCDCAYCRGEED